MSQATRKRFLSIKEETYKDGPCNKIKTPFTLIIFDYFLILYSK